MAKKSPTYLGEPEGEPENTPTDQPIEVVDLDTAIAAENTPPQSGQAFWFGEVGLIHFPDKTKFHATRKHDFITDPELIEKLKKAAENPSNKIFIE